MKRTILLILAILLLLPVGIYAWFSLTAGSHRYIKNDVFSFWLYTPEHLKHLPTISNNAVYEYDFDPDNQQTSITITWTDIEDIGEKNQLLNNFIKSLNGFNKYNCSWIYNDKNNYADNYQRYCVFKKDKTLQLVFFET